MNISALQDRLNKPYYFLRPQQVISRIRRKVSGAAQEEREDATLPWGLTIRIRPSDMIGAAVIRLGLYDICVCETLWRLVDPGETAIDAGANIGQMTSLLALRAGKSGNVLSFEPQPEIYRELESNVEGWKVHPEIAAIKLHEMGLSKEAGTANLFTSDEFESNRGTASLESSEGDPNDSISVVISRLDDMAGPECKVGVMKIDVEGHELSVFEGAEKLLSEGRLRDIVFEDKSEYPSPVTEHLKSRGYTIFNIEQGPFSLRISPVGERTHRYRYDAQNYLATLDPDRALSRLSSPGYKCLNSLDPDGLKKGLAIAAIPFAILMLVKLFKRR